MSTELPKGGAEAELVLREITSLLSDLHLGSGRQVHLGSDLVADLGLDSLALVELHDRLERAFGVELPEEALGTATTPADWLGAVIQARDTTTDLGNRGRSRPLPRRREGEPWPEAAQTLTEALAWHVEAHPDLVTIRLLGTSPVAPIEEVSYAALAREASAVATGLLAGGLGRGERVALMLPTGREYFTVFLGVLLAGGVPVPIYPPPRRSVLEEHLRRQARLLDNAGASVLVTVPEAMAAARLVRPLVPALRAVRTADSVAEAGSRHIQPLPVVSPGDIALIQYTSGSTGDPKGVVLTHAQLLANIAAMGRAAEVTSSDVFVSWLPLYHDMGLIGAWHAPMVLGLPLVVMSPLAFLARPVRWLEAISTYSGTLSAGPNFAYQSCVERISDSELAGIDLSSWRLAFNGSEAVSPATVERFAERFDRCGFRREAMCPAYGLAEMGVGAAFTTVGRGPLVDVVARTQLQSSGRAVPVRSGDPDARAVVSCGRPLPGYRVRVCDRHGNELPDRQEGVVECRGPSATSGYFANGTASRALWRNGWLETGDLGYLAGGELFLTGRAKDLIIRGGRNLHPEELEQAVGELDGVRREGVAAFATTDVRLGTERLVVVAETDVREPTARAALEAEVRTTAVEVLGTTPDQVVLARPGSIPKTPSGKIRRAATRDALESGQLGHRSSPLALQVVRLASSGLGSTVRGLSTEILDLCFGVYVWVLVGLIGIPLWFVALLPLPIGVRWRLTRAAGHALARLADITVRMQGALPPEGKPAVIVANHPSFVDALALILISPAPVVFVASTDLEAHRIIGIFLRRLGCTFVDRSRAVGSTAAVEGLANLLRRGHRLVIFPEGSISPGPGMRAFHLGAFAAAASAGCPVVPVGIRGSRDAVPPGTYLLAHRGRVTVTVGLPIAPTGTDLGAQVELRDSARQAVAELSGEPDVS